MLLACLGLGKGRRVAPTPNQTPTTAEESTSTMQLGAFGCGQQQLGLTKEPSQAVQLRQIQASRNPQNQQTANLGFWGFVSPSHLFCKFCSSNGMPPWIS